MYRSCHGLANTKNATKSIIIRQLCVLLRGYIANGRVTTDGIVGSKVEQQYICKLCSQSRVPRRRQKLSGVFTITQAAELSSASSHLSAV